jgi:hypothetical protein
MKTVQVKALRYIFGYSFLKQCVLRQVDSLFRNEFSADSAT